MRISLDDLCEDFTVQERTFRKPKGKKAQKKKTLSLNAIRSTVTANYAIPSEKMTVQGYAGESVVIHDPVAHVCSYLKHQEKVTSARGILREYPSELVVPVRLGDELSGDVHFYRR